MLNIHRIIYIYGLEGYQSSLKLVKDRIEHVKHLHKCMEVQARETKRREYIRQTVNNEGKIKFYEHLLRSKSELTNQSYNVNGEWMWF